MPSKRVFDPVILITTLILVVIGIAMVYSSSAVIAINRYNDPYYFIRRHILWVLIGCVSMAVMMRIYYGRLRSLTYPLMALSLFMLVLVLIPGYGKDVSGARRWLIIGFFSFQPAEFVKVVIALFFSHSLVKKKEDIKDFTIGFLPNVVVVGIFTMMILIQPDLGTAFLVMSVSLTMMYIGGVRFSHLMGLILFIMPFFYLAVFNVEYRRRRILAFIDPWKDPLDSGFQIIQSLVSFGRGHILGLGLGEGKQKLFFLPEPHTDFIFSVIGEELGFVGAVAVVIIFAVLIWRGARVSLRSPDLYGTYLALGITLMIGIQALINLSVTVGLLPTKGIPLPLISLGGSSLVITMTLIGILLNISENTV